MKNLRASSKQNKNTDIDVHSVALKMFFTINKMSYLTLNQAQEKIKKGINIGQKSF